MSDLWIAGPDDIASAETLDEYQSSKDGFVGCPVWWLQHVMSVVNTKEQLVVAIYLWRRRVVCGNHKTFDESRPQESEQDDKWSFCLTAGTLCPTNQER
jgi:hypothetical protein